MLDLKQPIPIDETIKLFRIVTVIFIIFLIVFYYSSQPAIKYFAILIMFVSGAPLVWAGTYGRRHYRSVKKMRVYPFLRQLTGRKLIYLYLSGVVSFIIISFLLSF